MSPTMCGKPENGFALGEQGRLTPFKQVQTCQTTCYEPFGEMCYAMSC